MNALSFITHIINEEKIYAQKMDPDKILVLTVWKSLRGSTWNMNPHILFTELKILECV
jgi:hypothetical protein